MRCVGEEGRRKRFAGRSTDRPTLLERMGGIALVSFGGLEVRVGLGLSDSAGLSQILATLPLSVRGKKRVKFIVLAWLTKEKEQKMENLVAFISLLSTEVRV